MGAESLDSARRYDMYVHTQYISFSATARVRHGENDGSGRMSGSTSAASSRLNSRTPAHARARPHTPAHARTRHKRPVLPVRPSHPRPRASDAI